MKHRQSFYWWFKLTGRYLHRDLIRGVKNMIRWFPLVFKDADWDNWFIYQTMKFKISNTAKYIGKHKRYVGCERDVEIMELVVRLIEKVQEESYGSEYQYFETGDFDLGNYQEYRKNQDYTGYFKKYPLIYKYVTQDPKPKDVLPCNDSPVSIALSMGHVNSERAKKILFKLLERNINKWWD